jgi:hypothetical protein
MSRDQQELFPGYNEKRAAAERQAREWQLPTPSTPPAPRWVNERGREVEPGHWPALPEYAHACPWRKPQRVILAQRVLDEENRHPWPNHDECHHPHLRETHIDSGEPCWPMLAELRVGPPPSCDAHQGGTER